MVVSKTPSEVKNVHPTPPAPVDLIDRRLYFSGCGSGLISLHQTFHLTDHQEMSRDTTRFK